MSNEEAIANLVGLMTSFHLEINALPDDLKCVKCKSVLKNACQMPCGCRFCRACIDDMISRGHQFCPGGSQECGATPLSTAQRDYSANKSVLKLTAKCPHAGCLHECPLADVQGHMHACSSKNIDRPFRQLGCTQGALPGDKMSGDLLQESCSHSEILIMTVANISRDVEMLKRELLMKDEQARHLENEIKSIKREKEVLCDRVRQLSEKLERDSTMVTAVTAATASIRDALSTEMKPVRDDIRSIRDQFDRMISRMESIQVSMGLGQLDDWLIEEDVAETYWNWISKTSAKFGGGECPFTYELASNNDVRMGNLEIYLCIYAGPSDSLLQWPFRGAVTVTIADRDRCETCSKQTRQCQVERPADNKYRSSDPFRFSHDALRGAGVHLERGVRVSCRIVPDAGK